MHIQPLSIDDIRNEEIRRAVFRAKIRLMVPGTKWVRSDQVEYVLTLQSVTLPFGSGKKPTFTTLDGCVCQLSKGTFLREWWPVDMAGMNAIYDALKSGAVQPGRVDTLTRRDYIQRAPPHLDT